MLARRSFRKLSRPPTAQLLLLAGIWGQETNKPAFRFQQRGLQATGGSGDARWGESARQAALLRSVYEHGFAFPSWSVDMLASGQLAPYASQAVVYYVEGEDVREVQDLATQREPVNIAQSRLYDQDLLEKHFGYRQGAYSRSSQDRLMPNIAIFCKTPIRAAGRPDAVDANVINLIGYAFDSQEQPDYQYFFKGGALAKEREAELIQRMSQMWLYAFECARRHQLERLYLANVGGGAFSELLPDYEALKFRSLSPVRKRYPEIQVHELPRIPDWALSPATKELLPKSLLVNAWDPWSMIGNGNAQDHSLDGFFGRSTAMAVLGWPTTNPEIGFESVPRFGGPEEKGKSS